MTVVKTTFNFWQHLNEKVQFVLEISLVRCLKKSHSKNDKSDMEAYIIFLNDVLKH